MNSIPYTTLSESDLEGLIALNQSKYSVDFKKPILMFAAVFGVLFIGLNLPAFFKTFTFHRPAKITIPEEKARAQKPKYSESNPSNVIIVNEPTDQKSINTDAMNNNEIYIPSVNIKAPINWSVAFNDSAIQQGLRTGVIQLDGTALPGEVGNVFISGHSSYLPFAQGNYKQIFATLPNTKLGDQIFIIRGGTLYTYKVENVFEVKPTEIEIIKQSTDSMLTLSTCVPIGTATRRFIVQAKQISPNPKNNQAFSGTALDLTKRIPAS